MMGSIGIVWSWRYWRGSGGDGMVGESKGEGKCVIGRVANK